MFSIDSVRFLKLDLRKVCANSDANCVVIDSFELLSISSLALDKKPNFPGCLLKLPDGYSPIVTLTGRCFLFDTVLDVDPFDNREPRGGLLK